MRNRAKCKLCKEIIESYHLGDYVSCNCGEISIDGGLQELLVYANDFANLMRVDDQGNEIIVQVDGEPKKALEPIKKLTKDELIAMLDEMAANIERLPQAAMTAPVTHYDLLSALLLISSIFKAR